MNIGQLIWREILHRKLNFTLSLLAVTLAVASAVSMVTLLRGHELGTKKTIKALDDEIRRITKNMGFNIMILPTDQNLAEFHATDFAAKTMPESFVHQLANSRDLFTINHLRPALIRKIDWPQQNRQIILMGVRGVVPLAHRTAKKPLAHPVPAGMMDVGYVLGRELKLEPGQKVSLLSEDFVVNQVYPQRGTKDDITVWIDLTRAQQMLSMAGRINMIQALECNCASIDRLAEVEAEISKVLGGQVQVVELSGKAIARAQARSKVAADGAERLRRLRNLTCVLMVVVISGAGLWVAMLSLANVRQRRTEIGLWRALGWDSRRVLTLFLSKAFVLGLAGSVIGYVLGFLATERFVSTWWFATDNAYEPSLFSMPVLLTALLAAPLLAVLAGWLPALAASQQDPAEVLRQD